MQLNPIAETGYSQIYDSYGCSSKKVNSTTRPISGYSVPGTIQSQIILIYLYRFIHMRSKSVRSANRIPGPNGSVTRDKLSARPGFDEDQVGLGKILKVGVASVGVRREGGKIMIVVLILIIGRRGRKAVKSYLC